MLNEKEGDTSVWDAVRLPVLATLHQTLYSTVQFVLACANRVIASCFGCGPKPLPLAGLPLGPKKFWSCVFGIWPLPHVVLTLLLPGLRRKLGLKWLLWPCCTRSALTVFIRFSSLKCGSAQCKAIRTNRQLPLRSVSFSVCLKEIRLRCSSDCSVSRTSMVFVVLVIK